MKKLIVIVLFIGLFTQSAFASYRHSALKELCQYGKVNGKYTGYAWDPKVCLRAISVVAKDKTIRYPHHRYMQAYKIAEKVCRRHGKTSVGGRKACQLEKYYLQKHRQSLKKSGIRGW